MTSTKPGRAGATNDRYERLFRIGAGGEATIYVGRVRGEGGFTRLVALKRPHSHLLEDPVLRQRIIDEARLASRIHHANVVSVLDVVDASGELVLVMDYVEGAPLSELFGGDPTPMPPRVAVRIALDAAAGLDAAHGLEDDSGAPLDLVHRDVSPHNILVGVDGVARLTDFGIAKGRTKTVSTTRGVLKGKPGYMAPEYVAGGALDARSDVFSLGATLWEALARRRLFEGETDLDTLKQIAEADAPRLSDVAAWVGSALDDVLARALARRPEDRFESVRAFHDALERAAREADLAGSRADVAAFVAARCGDALAERRERIRRADAEADASARAEATRQVEQRRGDAATASGGAREAPAAADPARRRWLRAIAIGIALAGLIGAGVLFRRAGPGAATSEAPASDASAPAAASESVREVIADPPNATVRIEPPETSARKPGRGKRPGSDGGDLPRNPYPVK